MKTTITSLLIGCLLPAISIAQPVITLNEYYRIGDVVNMVRCDATGINSGASGAAANWDFSSITASGGLAVTTVAANNTAKFLTANIIITLPDGSKQYVKSNNTDSYVTGLEDNVTGITYNYDNFYFARRPVTYPSTSTIDTYRVNVVSGMYGTGIVTQGGDGYGTLKTPTGTYSNVVRVKRVISELDSVAGAYSGYNKTTSYMWFDTGHRAPLFRIDTVEGLTGMTVTTMYLASSTGVNDVSAMQHSFKGFINNNSLMITGDFVAGKEYEMALYNIIGGKVASEQFVANKNVQGFNVGSQLAPGIYVVNISDKNNPSDKAIIKVIKQ